MEGQYVRDNFISAYDQCADEIFAYCYEKTSRRDIAKYLTGNIFRDSWDTIVESAQDIENMEKFLWRKTKEHVNAFLSLRESQDRYTTNLWNLTLQQ